MSARLAPVAGDLTTDVWPPSLRNWVRFVRSWVLRHPCNRGHRARALARAVGWQIWKRTVGRPREVEFVGGTRLRVHPRHSCSALVLYARLPDYEDMLFLLRYLRCDDLVIDVGANVGVYTVLCASKAGAVTAFEPDPSAREELVRNLELNGLGNVQVRAEAVGDRCGEVWFSTGRDVLNRVLDPEAPMERRRVQMVTLDSFCTDHLEPALVKVDTEGTWAQVLAGAQRILALARPPIWLMEVDGLHGLTDPTALARHPLVVAMHRHGYEPFVHDPGAGCLVPGGLGGWSDNLLFVRGDQVSAVQARLGAPG